MQPSDGYRVLKSINRHSKAKLERETGNYSLNSDEYSNGINGIPGMKRDTQHEISVTIDRPMFIVYLF